MMNAKSITLMILSLIALLAFAPACGEGPDDDEDKDSGGDGDADSDSDTGSEGGAVDTSPVADLMGLVGNVYVLEIPADYWTKPAGVAKEVGEITPIFAFEIQSVDATAKTFTALLGTVKDGAQDTCAKTYQVTGSLTEGDATTFTLGPVDIDTIVAVDNDAHDHHVKVVATLHGFELSGQFVDQGDGYKYGSLAAELDARDVYSLFYAVTAESGENLCEQLPALGTSCQECLFEAGSELCLVAMAEAFKVSKSEVVTLAEVGDFGAGCLD